MGFFSNLKNAVTGGAASVQLVIPQTARRGDTIPLRVQATAKSSAKVSAVYVLVRAREHAQLRDTDWQGGKSTTETVHGWRTSFEQRVTLAGTLQLQEGQTMQWEGTFLIPASALASFHGQMCEHVWELQAGLDMTGNDPDSGWQPIIVG